MGYCLRLSGNVHRVQASLNQRVPGSSPGAPTNKINHLTSGAVWDLPRTCGWEEHGKIRRHMSQSESGGVRMTAAQSVLRVPASLNSGVGILHQCVGRRIDALHAGDKDEVAGPSAETPRTLRLDRTGRVECFDAVGRGRLREAET